MIVYVFILVFFVATRTLGYGGAQSHVKGHSSHALLRGLDGVTLVMRRMMRISPQPLGGEGGAG